MEESRPRPIIFAGAGLLRRRLVGRRSPAQREAFALPQDETFRLETLIAHMTPRLRPICAEWPEEVFSAMVRRLAEITLKYEGTPQVASTIGDRLIGSWQS